MKSKTYYLVDLKNLFYSKIEVFFKKDERIIYKQDNAIISRHFSVNDYVLCESAPEAILYLKMYKKILL